MGSPKLKFFLLPDGYIPIADNDIQQSFNDELLPFEDKLGLLNMSIPVLTGVIEVANVACEPVDSAGGRSDYPLTVTTGNDMEPTGITLAELVVAAIGTYELRVFDVDNALVDPTQWSIVGTAVRFVSAPPVGGKISAYSLSAVPATRWALPHDKAYVGGNEAFNRVVTKVDAGVAKSLTAAGTNKEYIDLASGGSAVVVSYWYVSNVTKDFIGEHGNWIAEHLEMWPDVFLGVENYPGDATDQPPPNPPLDPGLLPSYVDPGQYRMNFRDGMVSFPSAVDTTALKNGVVQLVRANYAYLSNIKNVTSAKLDVVTGTGGLTFKLDTEAVFPSAHAKRWVTRNNDFTPLKVYVDGVPKPTLIAVTPQEILTVKTGP